MRILSMADCTFDGKVDYYYFFKMEYKIMPTIITIPIIAPILRPEGTESAMDYDYAAVLKF